MLDCSEAMNKAQAVLVLQDRKAKAPDPNIARLWVTTPLTDAMDASWVINAPFEPDAGRSHISWRDTKNREKAAAFAAKLHKRFLELFDQVSQNTDEFGTAYEFWLSVWRLFRTKNPCFGWSDVRTSQKIHSWICWAQGSGAYRQLCETRAVTPSGLPGQLGSLLQIDQILYRLHGDFANYPRILETLASWEGFAHACPRAHTVSSEIANDLIEYFPNLSLEEVRLVDCLRVEIPRNAPISEQAINRFRGLAVSIEQYADEAWKKRQLEAFEDIFTECRFMAQDGGLRKIVDLLIPGNDDKEAMLLKNIAPQSRILSSDYALYQDFLVRFVTSLKPELDIIEQWAHESCADRLGAVFEYLMKGDKRQKLADRLKVSWFESQKNSPEYNQLDSPQKNELRRLFMSQESGANLETLIRALDGGPSDDESDEDAGWIIDESLSLEKLMRFWKESEDQAPYTLTGAWWDSLT